MNNTIHSTATTSDGLASGTNPEPTVEILATYALSVELQHAIEEMQALGAQKSDFRELQHLLDQIKLARHMARLSASRRTVSK